MAAAPNVEVKVRLQDILVPIDALKPNSFNTNLVTPENEKRIEESIKRLGMFKPLTVRELPDGTLEILGGQHRWEAARRLGYTQVPVFNVGRIPDHRAKEIGLADNARYGEDDTLALAALLKDLGGQAELGTFLPWDDADYAAIFSASSIALDDLDPNGQSELPDLPAARPAPTYQLMRFKVPVEDVAWITALVDKTMRDKNLTTEDSLTNAGSALVELLKDKK